MIDNTTQIMQTIAGVSKKVNDINNKLDALTNKNHKESLEYITENSDGVLDVASLSDENSTAIEELAEIVDNLLERVEALESKEV